MKRYLILALALLALGACQPKQPRLVILHVNDTHSHFEPIRSGEEAGQGGVIERAAYIDSVRAAEGEDNVLLLHAGDFNQGSSYFTQLGGDLAVATLNAMRYDAVTLGNHEFDNGIEDLSRRLKTVGCPIVCANYDFSPFELGQYVRPYVVLRKAGRQIGIIGMLTDITKVVDRNIADRLPKYDDAETAQKWADHLRNEEGCDLVIVLSHLGYSGDRRLVEATRNIDLVVGGHSHTFLEEMEYAANLDGEQVPIVQDGCWGLYMGRIEVR